MGSSGEPPSTHLTIVYLDSQYHGIPEIVLPEPWTFNLESYDRTAPSELHARLQDADIVLTCVSPIPAHALTPESAPRLKMISVLASGTDHIDAAACRKRGITICRAANANVASVSEHAIGLYFSARRGFSLTERSMRNNVWLSRPIANELKDGEEKLPLTCQDEVMGIVGFGAVGQHIAKLGSILGMKIVVAERKGASAVRADRQAFEEVLKQSSVLVIALPRTPESLNLISKEELKMMRPSAVIVNVARGGIVDEEALVHALKKRWIAGAGTDVFLQEPASPGNSVLMGPETEGLNLTLTPHLAWASQTTQKEVRRVTAENVAMWCAGKPQHVAI